MPTQKRQKYTNFMVLNPKLLICVISVVPSPSGPKYNISMLTIQKLVKYAIYMYGNSITGSRKCNSLCLPKKDPKYAINMVNIHGDYPKRDKKCLFKKVVEVKSLP